MSNIYHTPLLNGMPADAATFNSPLSELDQAIADLIAGVLSFTTLTAATINVDTINVAVALNMGVGAAANLRNTVVTGTIQVTGTSTLAAVNATTVTASGLIQGSNVTATSALSGATLAISSTSVLTDLLTANGGVTTTTLTATTVNASGTITGLNVTATSALTGHTIRNGTTAFTTIASGAFAVTDAWHVLDTEGAAATDDLVSITGGTQGQILMISNANNARKIRVVWGAGVDNIFSTQGKDYWLEDSTTPIVLVYYNMSWRTVTLPKQQWINIGGAQNVTIAAGVITASASSLIVATEGGASADVLDVINGGIDGMIISVVGTAGDVVTLKHAPGGAAGTILCPGNQDVTFGDGNNIPAILMYRGTQWHVIAINKFFFSIDDTYVGYDVSRLVVPLGSLRVNGVTTGGAQLDVLPDPSNRDIVYWRAEPTPALSGVGAANATIAASTNTYTANSDGYALVLGSAAVLNDDVRVRSSASYNALRRTYRAWLKFRIRMDGTITSMRLKIGCTAATYSNSDVAASAGAYFRYSTAAGDTTWKAVTDTGASQTVTDTGVSVVATTPYILEIRFLYEAGIGDTNVLFYINGALVANVSLTPPSASANLGWEIRLWTLSAAIRTFSLYRVSLQQGFDPVV